MKFRAATYNVRNTDGGKSLEGIAAELSESDADIIGLQELDRGVQRSGGTDLLSELGRRSGYVNGRFCRTIDYDGGEYGTGILTRHTIIDASVRHLPGGEEHRILTRFHIDISGRVICFFNTHLCLDAESRKQQMKLVAEEFNRERYAVLTGDFNVESFDEFKPFHNASLANRTDNAFHTFRTGRMIDNIITSAEIKVLSVFMSLTDYSDHNMLVADLETE